MTADFYCFGEILWDCLPSGRHAGGAPFNVAAHLVQLGASASILSAVGRDELGDELLQMARHQRIHTEFTGRHPGLPTGTVQVTIDPSGNASYEIVEPVAWDEIDVPADAVAAVAASRALIFGSLACRSPHNIRRLRALLATDGPLRFFDVNLRPPYIDPEQVIELARHADVLKLNHEELGMLAAWVETGQVKPEPVLEIAALARATAVLAEATGTSRICVTRGERGAAYWDHGKLVAAPAPEVTVKDTVGAGDSFMAGLVIGLARGDDPQHVLEGACRVGAYVASHHGATPHLPQDLKRLFAAAN